MKILMVSMFSLHFFRWTEQLKDAGHEIYWIDVFDSDTYIDTLHFVKQEIGWRNRIKFPGRYWIKKYAPGIYKGISAINQKDLSSQVKLILEEFRPDVVHSFVLQSGTLPLSDIMTAHPEIKWVYSAWGNDLYYRKNNPKDLEDIRKVLPKLDYMFADCTRDYFLAKSLGFKGKYSGTFPTGGGYMLSEYFPYLRDYYSRRKIMIKGYEGKLGRCSTILKAIYQLKDKLQNYDIVIFGAHPSVFNLAESLGLNKWGNLEVKGNIPHHEVLKLYGEAKIYIGNSISDGMPNTLLEAIVMEVYPIQSNPGGATAELIANGKNGSLIEDPEDVVGIQMLIEEVVENDDYIKSAIEHNTKVIRPFLERNFIQEQIINEYKEIEDQLS